MYAIRSYYGMYQVAADINNIDVRKVLLTDDFELDVPALLNACDDKTKMLFICSPNNPTGNSFKKEDIVITSYSIHYTKLYEVRRKCL